MVQKITEVTRIQGINYYDANSQTSGDTLKRKQEMSFQRILDRKLNEKPQIGSAAYTVDFKQKPR